MDILKISLIFLKDCLELFTILIFYFGMVLLNHIQPTLTHIHLPERKVKKVHTSLTVFNPLSPTSVYQKGR